MFPLRDANPRHGPAVVVWVLVALNVGVFLFQTQLEGRETFLFILEYAFIPRQFFGEPVRELATLITSTFLHGNFGHLLGNMFFLYVFGDNIEDRLGHFTFLAFYLLGGAVATLAHGLFAADSPLPLVGASGAISAVMGAYILLFPTQRVLTFIPPLLLPWFLMALFVRVPRFFLIWLPAWVYIGYWALIQLTNATGPPSRGTDNVAWWAHVGGFAVGLVVVSLFLRSRKRPDPDQFA